MKKSPLAGQGQPPTGPDLGPLGPELVELATTLSRCQCRLVMAAAAFAESAEWVLDGAPTPAHWLAAMADVEDSTAREWIRIGKALADLPVTAAAFESRRLSYSKVRTLTRSATPINEAELVDLVADVPASEAGKAMTPRAGPSTRRDGNATPPLGSAAS